MSDIKNRKQTTTSSKQDDPLIKFTDPELDDLINTSHPGLLKKINKPPVTHRNLHVESLAYTIGLVFLNWVMDYIVHIQYSFLDLFTLSYHLKKYFVLGLVVYVVVYFTNKFNGAKLMQALYLITSVVASIYLLYYSIKVETFGAMKMTPGLIMLWVYSVMQMDLLLSVVSLVFPLMYYYSDTILGNNKM